MNPLIQETIRLSIPLLLGFFLVAMMQRGFFVPFLRVKMSFGRLVLLKVKTLHRDYYVKSWVEEGFLMYKRKKAMIRLPIPNGAIFYRSMNVIMADYNEITNKFLLPTFDEQSAYDPEKVDSLLERAIMRPALIDNLLKILLILVIVAILVGAVSGYMGYMNSKKIELAIQAINQVKAGLVVPVTPT